MASLVTQRLVGWPWLCDTQGEDCRCAKSHLWRTDLITLCGNGTSNHATICRLSSGHYNANWVRWTCCMETPAKWFLLCVCDNFICTESQCNDFIHSVCTSCFLCNIVTVGVACILNRNRGNMEDILNIYAPNFCNWSFLSDVHVSVLF